MLQYASVSIVIYCQTFCPNANTNAPLMVILHHYLQISANVANKVFNLEVNCLLFMSCLFILQSKQLKSFQHHSTIRGSWKHTVEMKIPWSVPRQQTFYSFCLGVFDLSLNYLSCRHFTFQVYVRSLLILFWVSAEEATTFHGKLYEPLYSVTGQDGKTD